MNKVKIELKPNPNCKDCLGRGWLSLLHATDKGQRVIRPCHCVKTIVKERPGVSYQLSISIKLVTREETEV